MKGIFLCGLLAGMVVGPSCSAADDVSAALAQSISECSALPPDIAGLAFKVVMDVQLSGGELRRIDVKSYEPKTAQGKNVASALARGAQRCGPYGDTTGTINLTFSPDSPTGGVVVTMPD
jgi:hypothetical protein